MYAYLASNKTITSGDTAIMVYDGKTADSNVNLLTDDGKTLTLHPGVWAISAKVLFTSSAAGYRELFLADTNDTLNPGWRQTTDRKPAISGIETTLNISTIIKVRETTKFALYVLQNSGADLILLGGDNWTSLMVKKIL